MYTQWAMLIINLPMSWLPWSNTNGPFGSASDWRRPLYTLGDFVQDAIGIVFGRSASLDCFLQAWNPLQKSSAAGLQGGNMQYIVNNVFARAAGR